MEARVVSKIIEVPRNISQYNGRIRASSNCGSRLEGRFYDQQIAHTPRETPETALIAGARGFFDVLQCES
jgi:hypothetical protein